MIINGWKAVVTIIAGLATAIIGAAIANPVLISLGSTVVGGALGASMPQRQHTSRTRKED